MNDDSTALAKHPKWLQNYIHSAKKQRNLYRRTLMIVVISQIFGGAGPAAGITVGALLAQQMFGTDSFTGVPTALIILGSAGAALLAGRLSQRFGRRSGLAAGFLAGGIGAIGVVISAVINSILLLFVSLFIYGAGTAANLQARYAGTDLANPTQRATAISVAMVSTTFGAVSGPNLVNVMGHFATKIGVPALSGPFILAAATYILAGLFLLFFLRPDPLIIAKAIAQEKDKNNLSDENSNSLSLNKRGVVAAAIVMVLTQLVMVAIMTMTPVHMGKHGHGLSEVGMIIGFHISAMYLPSLLTGILVDKIGRTAMAIASGITLLAAGILAALAPVDSIILLTVALVLLGFGWNFGLISGTTLLVDATNLSNRAKAQGSVDVMVALSGASGGVLSGIVADNTSYATLSVAGGLFSLLLIPVVLSLRKNLNKKRKKEVRTNNLN